MEPEILVVAEHNQSEIDPITYDLVSWGARIAAEKSWKLGVLVVGRELDQVLETIRSPGIDVVLSLDHPALEQYNSCVYVDVISRILLKSVPHLILLGHTYLGVEVSGGLAAKLDASLWTNCRSIKSTARGFVVTRPVFKGAFLSTLEIESGACNLITLQRGSAPILDLATKNPECIDLCMPAESDSRRIRVKAETKTAFAEDITKADLLVAVGRGIGQESQLAAYRDLAQALGGSVAASRPIVDMGWLSVDHQVGMSGRTVRPKVYVACGISGSMQHVVGMRDARLIIAINKDADAPIFQVAHYGVVGDLVEILPALITEATRIADMQEKGAGNNN